jgi:hypothetical protein
MSNRETETQSYGETEDTQETEDVPPLAASVKTLQEAVQLSLKDGLNKDCLFTFARALKAFEITTDRRLPPEELQAAFSLWWSAAKPFLSPDADPDEWRFDFEDTFAKTHAPLGSNSLEEAIRRADTGPMPSQSARYSSPKIKRLVAICYHLQLLQGNSPFFLGVRDAAQITGIKNLYQANARLGGLVRDGVLIEVEKGTRKRATRFRFSLPDSAPIGDTNAPAPAKATAHNAPEQRLLPAVHSESKAANPPTPRKPTTYELAERKKALQDLIKGLPHEDYWEAEDRKRYKNSTRNWRMSTPSWLASPSDLVAHAAASCTAAARAIPVWTRADGGMRVGRATARFRLNAGQIRTIAHGIETGLVAHRFRPAPF